MKIYVFNYCFLKFTMIEIARIGLLEVGSNDGHQPKCGRQIFLTGTERSDEEDDRKEERTGWNCRQWNKINNVLVDMKVRGPTVICRREDKLTTGNYKRLNLLIALSFHL